MNISGKIKKNVINKKRRKKNQGKIFKKEKVSPNIE